MVKTQNLSEVLVTSPPQIGSEIPKVNLVFKLTDTKLNLSLCRSNFTL